MIYYQSLEDEIKKIEGALGSLNQKSAKERE